MPGRVKFDFIEPVTIAIERPQLRREFVGIEAKLDGLRLAELGTQRFQFSAGPSGAFAADSFAQNGVA